MITHNIFPNLYKIEGLGREIRKRNSNLRNREFYLGMEGRNLFGFIRLRRKRETNPPFQWWSYWDKM
jgi:hypothetical protein